MLAERRRLDAAWRRDVRRRWGAAMDVHRMVWVICHEVGESVDLEHRPDNREPYPITVDALLGLQARACRVALDMYVLLENGLGQGALARV